MKPSSLPHRAHLPSVHATARYLGIAALAISTIGPMVLLVIWSVSGEWFFPALSPQRWSLDGWRWLLGGGRIAVAVRNSVVLGLADGVIGCAIAFPIGRAISRLKGWRRYTAAAAIFSPVAAPPIALGIGIQYFVLRLGVGGTAIGVLLAHLVPTIGYLSLYFLSLFVAFDRRVEDEARTLGATARQVLFYVTVPLMRRPIAEAIAIGFLISWAQYALTLIVGGGAVHTLPLEVFSYMRAGSGNYAASSALVMILPPLLALAAARYAAGRTALSPV
ncbi:MAG: ABC transporter permease subunit [Gemmatimonadaceae bacterium]